jgi:ankyrin repeat protein
LQVDAGGNQEQARLRRQCDSVDSTAEESNDGEELLQAAEKGDEESVERLLRDGQLDPNLKDSNDCTPLLLTVLGKSQFPEHWSHSKRRHDLVARLLLADRRLNPNCRDSNGRTPLSHAAERGDTSLIGQLLKHEKIEPNCIDVVGHTPLSRAAAASQAPAVRMLIKHRLIPESKDTSGRTALSWAMKCFERGQYGSTENQQCGIVELLLSLDDVDANSRDKEGRTPLSWAITYLSSMDVNLSPAFQTLFDQSSDSLSSKDLHGRTLLSRAAECGQRTVIEQLLRKSINPDMKDDDGRTPLSQAAAEGRSAVVSLLLQQKSVDPDSRDEADRTPLWWAAKGGHKAVIESLLAKKVEPDPMDQDLRTPLLCAVENKHTLAIQLLLQRDRITLHILAQDGVLPPLQFLLTAGSNVNARNIDGRTPLHNAAKSGHIDIARELICWKADINCKDTDGKTPLLLALEEKRHGLVQLLLEHSAQTQDIMSAQWLDAYEKGRSEVAVELSQSSCGKQSLLFVKAHQINVSSQMGLARRLL